MFKTNRIRFSNGSGSSLIEVLAAVSIMSGAVLAVASALTSFGKQNRALNEKLGSMETFKFVTAALADSTFCSASVTLPSPVVFDSTALPASSSIPGQVIPLGPGQNAARVGEIASPGVPTLIVSALDLANIQNAGTSDYWSGDVRVAFDATKLALPLRPLIVRILFQTDPASPPNAKRVVSCGINSVSSEMRHPTLDDVNNAGGRPCSNPCSGSDRAILWTSGCAGTWCRAADPQFKGGIAQNWNCPGGLGSSTDILCFK